MQAPDTILFIHGLWLTPRSWEGWLARYQERGLSVLAPSWPGLEAEVEELNRDPSPLTRLDVAKVVDHYDRIIRSLERPPVIIGHSIGATFAQLLVDRGLGAAAVGVAPGPVKGLRDLPLSTLRASRPVLGLPFNRGNATPLTPKQFRYAFANTLTRAESDAIYRRYHVPAANRVLAEVAFANLHRRSPVTVDFGRDERAPLLFIGYERDHVVTARAASHLAGKYRRSKALTKYTEFPGRPHFPGAPGWEAVADYAIAWALDTAVAAALSPASERLVPITAQT